MDKDILQLFSISDSDIIISDYSELGNCKYITVEKKPGDTHTCPECGCNMRSKGIFARKVKHSVLQGIGNLMINLRQKNGTVLTVIITKETLLVLWSHTNKQPL